MTASNPLLLADPRKKLEALDGFVERALSSSEQVSIPEAPGRDVLVLPLKELPQKQGLSSVQGQGRLLHDLASIELQAMELGLRTLCEFPDAPAQFRMQLADVVRDEGRHLKMCLDRLEHLGFGWGHWPVHIGLWQAASTEDDLIDRVLIVHRYLEGSGLDASEAIRNKLSGVVSPSINEVVRVIGDEEVGHVLFGSNWFRRLCEREKLDSAVEFKARLDRFFYRIPRRLEKIAHSVRKQAGFTDSELEVLEGLRSMWSDKSKRIHPREDSATCPQSMSPGGSRRCELS